MRYRAEGNIIVYSDVCIRLQGEGNIKVYSDVCLRYRVVELYLFSVMCV